MKKVLLSAFEPFGGQSINASQEVARVLQSLPFENTQIEVLQLPVEWNRAPELVLCSLARLQPDILIMLGEAGGRAAITPERLAFNVDDFPIPDNAGNQPRQQATVEGAPVSYLSTLPLEAIHHALQTANIPSNISHSAGTYVCNHLFYRVMHHLAETQSPVLAGFIHLPLLPQQRPTHAPNCPSLTQEAAVKGVQIAIETCFKEVADEKRSA